MLFITNRFFKQSIRTRRGRAVDFGLGNNAPSNSVYYCRCEAAGRCSEIGSAAFMDEIRACPERINVIAHSMGNRVLRETLRAREKYDLASGVPLLIRNAFLVAADIVNESLEYGRPGELICHASRNVLVYYASDDLALRASKVSNLKNKVASRRLGHAAPADLRKVPGNVYAIDCDDFNTAYDPPKGHSYFLHDQDGRPGKVFGHIYQTIASGRVFPGEESRRTMIL